MERAVMKIVLMFVLLSVRSAKINFLYPHRMQPLLIIHLLVLFKNFGHNTLQHVKYLSQRKLAVAVTNAALLILLVKSPAKKHPEQNCIYSLHTKIK